MAWVGSQVAKEDGIVGHLSLVICAIEVRLISVQSVDLLGRALQETRHVVKRTVSIIRTTRCFKSLSADMPFFPFIL